MILVEILGKTLKKAQFSCYSVQKNDNFGLDLSD